MPHAGRLPTTTDPHPQGLPAFRRRMLVRQPAVSHWTAISCLIGAALVYAHPLIIGLFTSLPGPWTDPEVVTTIWNTWWVGTALEENRSLFHTDTILIPFGADLRVQSYGPLLGLLALPFARGAGYVGAANIAIVLTLLLNGGTTYWLLYREIRQRGAAMVGASLLMLATPMTRELVGGRAAAGSIWTVALALASAGSLLDRPRFWNIATLALALCAALFADRQLFLAAMVWLIVYASARIARHGRTVANLPRLAGLLVAVFPAVAAFLIIYMPAWQAARDARYPLPSVAALSGQSYRLGEYVQLATIQSAYGYEFLAAAVGTSALFWWRGEYRVWLVGALIFLVLALGPTLTPTSLFLPVALAAKWPLAALIDAPRRFMLPATLGLSVVAAFFCARLFHRLPSRRAVAPLAVAFVALRAAASTLFEAPDVQRFPAYEIYSQIASDRAADAILEVPFGVRSSTDRIGTGGDVLQFFQVFHGKKIPSGLVRQAPSSVLEFYRDNAALRFLSGEGPPKAAEPLDRDFEQILGWTQARYVIIHRGLLSAEHGDLFQAFLHRQQLLERLPEEADLIVFRVREAR